MSATEAQAPAYRSRKGDLVAIELRETSMSVSHGLKVTTSWVIGVVEQATRDGLVAKVAWQREPNHDPTDRWSRPWRRYDHVRIPGRTLPAYARNGPVRRVRTINRLHIQDRNGLLTATDHLAYESLDALRDVVRPFLWPD